MRDKLPEMFLKKYFHIKFDKNKDHYQDLERNIGLVLVFQKLCQKQKDTRFNEKSLNQFHHFSIAQDLKIMMMNCLSGKVDQIKAVMLFPALNS